jgi:hypothetical protein
VVNHVKSACYCFELGILQGDADLLLSDINEKPDWMDHIAMDVEKGDSMVRYVMDDSKLADIPFLYLAVVARDAPARYRLVCTVKPQSNEIVINDDYEDTNLDQQGVQCSNCQVRIPPSALTMHELYCKRNNTKCNLCGRIFQNRDFANHWHCKVAGCGKYGSIDQEHKHMSCYHQAVLCECGLNLELHQVANHRKTECPMRLIICRFCRLTVQAGAKSRTAKDLYLGTGLTEHESECGARTIECQKCKKSIQLKG